VRIVHLLIGGDVAGGQIVALRLARAAKAAGHDVGFVSPSDGPALDAARDEGFDVHLLGLTRIYRVTGAVALSRLLRTTKADLLHTHTQVVPNVLGRLAARAAGVPVISHLHIENHFRAQPLARYAYRSLDNATSRLCERIVAVSESTRDALLAQGYPSRRVEVVPNGVDLDDGAAPSSRGLREEFRLDPAAPVVAHVARLAEVKGQRTTIEALPALEGVNAVFVGRDLEFEGAYQGQLEQLAERLGVADRVVFAGYVRDVDRRYAEFDVVVLPSLAEGLPLVLLEALAHARPVIATPVGGTPELVVNGETGLLVPPGDSKALAEAVRRLLDDPGLGRRLGEAGRELVRRRYSAERQAERILAIYEEVVG
jgi:glycosyltransferase involved in cell wall biosynthesis